MNHRTVSIPTRFKITFQAFMLPGTVTFRSEIVMFALKAKNLSQNEEN